MLNIAPHGNVNWTNPVLITDFQLYILNMAISAPQDEQDMALLKMLSLLISGAGALVEVLNFLVSGSSGSAPVPDVSYCILQNSNKEKILWRNAQIW